MLARHITAERKASDCVMSMIAGREWLCGYFRMEEEKIFEEEKDEEEKVY